MLIGQVGLSKSYYNISNRGSLGMNSDSLLSILKKVIKHDRVEIGKFDKQSNEIGIYQPNGNQMRTIHTISCTKIAPDESLQKELLPPSECREYTEEDALVNQYMKQFRIDGYFDGDTFVQTSSEPVKLILKEQISKEDLESFKNELIKNGLGNDIDWTGVESDFIQMGMNFDNIERFGQKVDYLASRYAVLKDRIQKQYTGDEQDSEMQRLEQVYTRAKEEMANSFAENIGRFYEDLGQTGAIADMRDSVLSAIDSKTDMYYEYFSQNDIYANITDSDKQWLKQDDGYMSAKLRESVSEVKGKTKAETTITQVLYSEKDLVCAGIYAKEFSQQLKEPRWDTFTAKENNSDLGKYLAEQYKTVSDNVKNARISDKLSDMIKNSFKPFIEKFIDALDAKIDQNRERVAMRLWQSGLIRTNYIDRNSVYDAFQNSIADM